MNEEKIKAIEKHIEGYKKGIKNHQELMGAAAWMANNSKAVADRIGASKTKVSNNGYIQTNSEKVIKEYKAEISKLEKQIKDLKS